MSIKTVTLNRKAYHNYHIVDSVEAGIVLTGTEIKSIRGGRIDLSDAYARAEKGEMWLLNAHIAPYDPGSYQNQSPKRPRKLLLHRDEIIQLSSRVAEKGHTLVPLKLYIKKGIAKVELGVAKGKKQYDKRQAITEREVGRQMERALKQFSLKKR